MCGDWAERARADIAASRPAAVVVDLAADSGARSDPQTPCDPAFRARYRSLLGEAVGIWTAGASSRPVLVLDGSLGTRAGRCLDALLAEAVVDRPALVPLPVRSLLCPPGRADCDGTGRTLDDAQRVALGRAMGDAVAAELGATSTQARAAELRAECAGSDDVRGAGC